MFAFFFEQVWQDISQDSRSFIACLFALAFCLLILGSASSFWLLLHGIFLPAKPTTKICDDEDEEEDE